MMCVTLTLLAGAAAIAFFGARALVAIPSDDDASAQALDAIEEARRA